MRNCTTHHYACDCREDKAKRALDIANMIINYNLPVKPIIFKSFVRYYKELYGYEPQAFTPATQKSQQHAQPPK